MSKENKTILWVDIKTKDQAKLVAIMKKMSLQDFVEKTLRAEINKNLKGVK